MLPEDARPLINMVADMIRTGVTEDLIFMLSPLQKLRVVETRQYCDSNIDRSKLNRLLRKQSVTRFHSYAP